jgi:hypothetical protein
MPPSRGAKVWETRDAVPSLWSRLITMPEDSVAVLAVRGVVEDGDYGVRVVLAYETGVVLGGEVEALAFEVAWLIPVGTWTAQSPDDAVV